MESIEEIIKKKDSYLKLIKGLTESYTLLDFQEVYNS